MLSRRTKNEGLRTADKTRERNSQSAIRDHAIVISGRF
jgi:hypothetical protein